MLAAPERQDAVDKRDLLEPAKVVVAGHDFPAVVDGLVDARVVCLGSEVQVHVALKVGHVQLGPVERQGHRLVRDRACVVRLLPKHLVHVVAQPPPGQRKARVIRQKCNGGVRLAFDLCNAGLFDHAHVVLEPLLVLEAALGVHRLDLEPGRKDVGGLAPDAVGALDDALDVVVVVGRGQQVAENQLGNIDVVVLRVLGHLDTRAVVGHAHNAAVPVHAYLDALDRAVAVLLPDPVVDGVAQDFAENLGQSGNVLDAPLFHALALGVKDPRVDRVLFDGANVHAMALQDVLAVLELFVLLG